MTEIERIIDQAKRAFEGEAWHGLSVMEILADVSASMANQRLRNSSHTIWEITLHMVAWIRYGRMSLEGRSMPVSLDDKDDWPLVGNINLESWNNTITHLKTEHEMFITELSKQNDSKLNMVVPGREYNFYFLLHGVIQHNLYHAGQISYIKSSMQN